MIPSLRAEYNDRFSFAEYSRMVKTLEEECGCSISFRIAETPLFLPKPFAERAGRLAEEILYRAASPELQKIGATAVPSDFSYAAETSHPHFGAVDFAITGSRENPELKLIELQGFPSLFHYQATYSQVVRDVYDLDPELTGLLYPEMGYDTYYEKVRELIVGDEDPNEVILLELSPFTQKTLPDFLLARKQLGIHIVDLSQIETRGKDLYFRDDQGKVRRISRVYNRSIQDEIVAKGAKVPFDITVPYNVSWAGHPNWYFRISKVLLPHLVGTNEAVPNAFYVSDVDLNTLDLSRYVLKPLYSFAGAGVIVNPTREDVESISSYARHHWLLQERVEYAGVITSPDEGEVKAELRVLLGWSDNSERPEALHTLVRLTRGSMVGVDQNKGLSWVGSSCALVPAS